MGEVYEKPMRECPRCKKMKSMYPVSKMCLDCRRVVDRAKASKKNREGWADPDTRMYMQLRHQRVARRDKKGYHGYDSGDFGRL